MGNLKEQRSQIQRARVARSASEVFSTALGVTPALDGDLKLTVAGQGSTWTAPIPREALVRFIEILDALGDGEEPSVLPSLKELSTGEVASLLGVSRQYVVRLVDSGRIPSRRVGNRRRIRVDEALRYMREDTHQRAERYRDLVRSES